MTFGKKFKMNPRINLPLHLAAPALVTVFFVTSCSTVILSGPTPLDVRIEDSNPNRARYFARSANDTLITVIVVAEPYDQNRHGIMSIDGDIPFTVLRVLRVTMNGVEVDIPNRAYSKLGNPHIGSEYIPLKIEYIAPDIHYINISGGDGAGADVRRLVFSGLEWIRTEHRDSQTWQYVTKEEASLKKPNKSEMATPRKPSD